MQPRALPRLRRLYRVSDGRLGLSVIVLAIASTYAGLALPLARQWAADSGYSHGFVVVPLACWFAWRRRARLRTAEDQPAALGLLVTGLGLVLFAVGIAGAEPFFARASLLAVIAGAVLFVYGPTHLRIVAFPLAFLLLMIPLPAILFNQATMPLQLLASHVGESALRGAGVAVLRQGNVLELASMRLEVAEACSGIRSLVSIVTVALAFGEFQEYSTARRAALVAAAVPAAVAANAGRVAMTGMAAHMWGPSAAQGLMHDVAGTAVFLAALGGVAALDAMGNLRTPWWRARATGAVGHGWPAEGR